MKPVKWSVPFRRSLQDLTTELMFIQHLDHLNSFVILPHWDDWDGVRLFWVLFCTRHTTFLLVFCLGFVQNVSQRSGIF